MVGRGQAHAFFAAPVENDTPDDTRRITGDCPAVHVLA